MHSAGPRNAPDKSREGYILRPDEPENNKNRRTEGLRRNDHNLIRLMASRVAPGGRAGNVIKTASNRNPACVPRALFRWSGSTPVFIVTVLVLLVDPPPLPADSGN